LKGRFDVNIVVRIERQDDPHTISNKWADFSSGTIKKMIADGLSASIGSIKNNYSLRRYRFSTDITDWYLPTIFLWRAQILEKAA
jgi:hypothetical protein